MSVVTSSHIGQNVIAFAYAIGDRVYLTDADVYGRVKQLCATPGCREYFIAYFDDDKVRRTEWVGEDELSRS